MSLPPFEALMSLNVCVCVCVQPVEPLLLISSGHGNRADFRSRAVAGSVT